MSESVQITLIICLTIIIFKIISCIQVEYKSEPKTKVYANEKDTSRLDEIFDNKSKISKGHQDQEQKERND